MKRIITLLLAVLLLPILPSCKAGTGASRRLMAMEETERGYALYGMLSQGLRDTHSFAVYTEMDFSAKANGKTYRSNFSGQTLCRDQNGPGRTEYYEEIYEISPEGTYGNAYVYRTVDGYAEGYLFRAREESLNGEETYSGAFKSPLPYAEYAEEYAAPADSVLLDVELWICERVTCQRQEDGSWQAVFSGLDGAGINELDYLYGVDMSYVNENAYLADAEVTVIATPELLFDRVLVTLYYSDGSEDSSHTEYRYSVTYESVFAYEVPADEPSVDLSLFADGGDLTVADDFFYFLEELVAAPRGSCSVDSRSTSTADGESETMISRYEVEYDTHGDVFTFEDKGVEGLEGQEVAYRSKYDDGVMTFYVTDPETGEVYRNGYEMSDEEARAILAEVIWYEDLFGDSVMGIETPDGQAGKYRLRLGAGLKELYRSFFLDMKGSMTDFEAWVDVVMTEDTLVSYEYHVRAAGFTDTVKNYTYETVFSCVFRSKIDASEQV